MTLSINEVSIKLQLSGCPGHLGHLVMVSVIIVDMFLVGGTELENVQFRESVLGIQNKTRVVMIMMLTAVSNLECKQKSTLEHFKLTL